MSFFDRNRAKYVAAGVDPARIPPGQYVTERWPVLHEGAVPSVDTATWAFTVDGLVAEQRQWDWEEFRALDTSDLFTDIHCVTKWTMLDTRWQGVSVRAVWDVIEPDPAASAVMVRDVGGYTANLPVDDFLRDGNMFAHTVEGMPLEAEHGGPMRLVVPHLYFWKSVKWVAGFTVLTQDEPGFWEQNGYHIYGDPFQEQRLWND
ncbi:MAG: sulfite oxidase-like oxidoreductase [Acidimicrobiia bacterium]|nr:MAG: sulfite oxidase-like oxidoreductase [Acidimicrobiia bacterium]